MKQAINIELLKAELARDEGLSLKPYRCTAGKLTIGYGRNLDDVGITESEADIMLLADIEKAICDLDRAFPWWRRLSDARQRALVNMLFNLGLRRLKGFVRMLYNLQHGNYEEAAGEALNSNWAAQVGDRADRIAGMIREG